MLPANDLVTPAAGRLRLPVAVVSGAAGAGKTAVLTCLLAQQPTARTAVVLSTAPGAAAGAPPHGPGLASLTHTEEKPIRLALGADCQRVRADLLLEISRLARPAAYDYLLVENNGGAEAAPVGHTLAAGRYQPAYGPTLPEHAYLAALLTVVDAPRLLADLWAPIPGGATGALATAEVLLEQIEHAHVLVLNKMEAVAAADLAYLQALLHQLNPTARLLTTTHGQVAAAEVWTGTERPGVPAPPAGGYCFRDERPFHPERLCHWMHAAWPRAAVRSEGLCWLASRPDEVLHWQQAGLARRLTPVGTWWAAVPDRHRDPAYRHDEPALLARWHPQFQDRLTTLHFRGPGLATEQLQADLEACLCTPLEISRWRRGHAFADPWPRK